MRVGTQGLFRLCLKTFVAPFLPARLTAPGSPRMGSAKSAQGCRRRVSPPTDRQEVFNLRSTVTLKSVLRLDWTKRQEVSGNKEKQHSSNVCLTHVNSTCNQNKYTELIFVEHKKEKKRKYQQRVIDVELASFTPLVFSTNGGMGKMGGERGCTNTVKPRRNTYNYPS